MIAEDAGFGVGSQKDRSDVLHAGRIGRHQIFPECALARRNIDTEDVRRQLSGLIDVERMCVGAPGNGLLALIDAGNRLCIAAIHRIQVSSLVGTNGSDRRRVRRDRERVSVHALRRNGSRFRRVEIVDVELLSLFRLVA